MTGIARMEGYPGPQTIGEAVYAAQVQGWILESQTADHAILSIPAKAAVDTGFHLVNAIVTVLTCGIWLVGWLILWAIIASTTRTEGQRLFITKSPYGGVIYTMRPIT